MKESSLDRVRLGAFEVDLRAGELRQGEQKTYLREQPWFILRMLVERAGEVVTREEIRQQLWPNDTVVDFDQGINAAIRRLRQALGDSADEPIYLGTVARRGYRLLVPVEPLEPGKAASFPGPTDQEKPKDEPASRIRVFGGELIGKKVSHYRVLEVIGGGGMGMVYRGEDLKLGRQVALKFLPEDLSVDDIALQRFEREAQTASALNHPSICTIHGVEDYEGQPFIVMELLHGETLRDRLELHAAKNDGLALTELLDIALQICQALKTAHQQGIVHRDIKPANIFLTTSGQVKILDFGLAKIVESDGSLKTGWEGTSMHRTADQPLRGADPNLNLTMTGVNMGTASYMSPEQIRGERLDGRTDLFSFGLVLYQMATGQQAFTGTTIAEVHEGIQYHEPTGARHLNPGLPGELEHVITHALEKDRDRRYQSAAQIIADLQVLQRPKSERTRIALWLAAVVVAIILGAASFFALRMKSSKPELAKDATVRPLIPASPDNPLSAWVALSPDGKHLAYSDQSNGLSILQIDTGESHSFLNTTTFNPLSWLKDGDHLLVSKLEESGTWNMSTMDGGMQKFRDGNVHLFPSPVSQQFAFLDGLDIKIEDPGQPPRKLVSLGNNWVPTFMTWAPNGRRIAFDESRVVQLDGSKPKTEVNLVTCDLAGHCSTVLSNPRLFTGSDFTSLAWLPDGRIVFALGELPPNDESANLWSLDVDPVTGKTSGQPKRLTNWSGVEPKSLSASADGTRLALLQHHVERRVKIAALRAGGSTLGKIRLLNSDTWHAVPSGWTDDSRSVLFTGYRHGQKGIFQQSIDNGSVEILASSEAYNLHPVVSPDGKWLFYTEYSENDRSRLMRTPLAGGAPTIMLQGDYGYGCASTPGGLCVLSELKGDRLVFSRLDPLKGRGEELLSAQVKSSSQPAGLAYGWSLSPDGKEIALVAAESENQISILGIGGGVRVITLNDWRRLQAVSWAPDGRHLYISGGKYLAVEQIMWAILETDPYGNFKVLIQVPADRGWLAHPVPSPDGHYLAYTEWESTSSVVMLEKF